MKSLGADKVIDYTKEDLTRNGVTYDLIFDVVGATTFDGCRNLLQPEGIFLSCITGLPDVARSLWTAIMGGKQMRGGVAINTAERMAVIAELAATGKLKPIIDQTYPLEQIARGFQHVERGHKRGNVVIAVEHP